MLEQLRKFLREQDEHKVKKIAMEPSKCCESALERVEWAYYIVNDQHEVFMSLLEDLRLATEAVSVNLKSYLP